MVEDSIQRAKGTGDRRLVILESAKKASSDW